MWAPLLCTAAPFIIPLHPGLWLCGSVKLMCKPFSKTASSAPHSFEKSGVHPAGQRYSMSARNWVIVDVARHRGHRCNGFICSSGEFSLSPLLHLPACYTLYSHSVCTLITYSTFIIVFVLIVANDSFLLLSPQDRCSTWAASALRWELQCSIITEVSHTEC